MSRLRRKLADSGFGPASGGFFHNYESEVQPMLSLDDGEQQFNTLDRNENYWKSDVINDTENSEWSLQEGSKRLKGKNVKQK